MLYEHKVCVGLVDALSAYYDQTVYLCANLVVYLLLLLFVPFKLLCTVNTIINNIRNCEFSLSLLTSIGRE